MYEGLGEGFNIHSTDSFDPLFPARSHVPHFLLFNPLPLPLPRPLPLLPTPILKVARLERTANQQVKQIFAKHTMFVDADMEKRPRVTWLLRVCGAKVKRVGERGEDGRGGLEKYRRGNDE